MKYKGANIKIGIEVKCKEGVTLVSLVLTIIVLLILAGVGIYLVVNNGLLDKAQNATKENRKKQL